MGGPVAEDPGWQAREETGFDPSPLVVDWERQVGTGPAGQPRIAWRPQTSPASGLAFEARVARQACPPWTFRARGTRAKIEPRIVGLHVREPDEAWQTARQRQTTPACHQHYAARSGSEATHAQAVRRCGIRRSRSIGLAKTHLQHLLTATAINVVRGSAWVAGIAPAATRCSRFAALQWA
jgi:transposase